MATQEEWPFASSEKFFGSLRDTHFGTASIGDQGMRRGVARDFRKKINRRGNWQSDVDKVGALQRSGEFTVERRIDSASCMSFTDNVGAVPSGDANVRRVFAQRQTE
jgi:hypothetical protein